MSSYVRGRRTTKTLPRRRRCRHSTISYRALENVQRPLVALLLHQNVVGVVGRDGKDRDAVPRQCLRDAGQYPDEREVQHPLDAEAPPPVVSLNNVRRDIAGGAYQGVLFIRLTGSNAFLLSSDLATLFTGRHREIHVLPFSFGEFRAYFGGQGAIDEELDRYIERGGLAGSYGYRDMAESYGYIRDVYRTILTRDLVQKFRLPDTLVLERLAEYMMDNTGNLNSPNSIANTLDANKVSTNHVTVGRYISHLRDAFVFYEAKRYDIKGKKYLSTQAKHYVCDTGMRYAVLGTRNMDWGRMYENSVFLELIRRGYETYVGKLYQKEVDFVVKRGSEQVYIQVSDNVDAPETLERELAPLRAIRDAYPKVLIARTRHDDYTIDGIRVLDLARWLIGEQGF